MALCINLIDLENRITSLVPLADGSYVIVDSGFDCDIRYYKTIVFAADKVGNVICRAELDTERYDTIQEMRIGHKAMCKKWRKKYE